jgi:FkbM family methyltransferase
MLDTWLNGRWCLKLPEHRAARPVWPWWEATRLACMHHYLGQGGHVVWDVGAEEGDFPALWSSWGNDVVLWEANPAVWPNIVAIWEANDLTQPLATFPGFAAEQDGEGHCGFLSTGWPRSADGPVIPDHGFCNLSERPDIPRLRIDTAATKVAPPTGLTIDTEGSELRVLQGAEDVLRIHRPLVWVSVHRDFMRDMYNDTPEDLDNFMADLSYERTPLCTDHEQHVFFWPKERELFVQ